MKIFSPFTIFEQLALALKKQLPWKLSLILNVVLVFRIFNNLRLPWKQSLPWNFSLYWNIFCHSGFFEQLALALKNSRPEIFRCIEYPFYIREFWATCACPKKLALGLKNRAALNFFNELKYFYHSGFLSNFALALKNRAALKFLTVLNILFTFRGFANCPCPEKQRVPWIDRTEYVFFIIQDFWETCACPENRVYPEIFQTRGCGRPPPDPRLVRLCSTEALGLSLHSLLVNPALSVHNLCVTTEKLNFIELCVS